MNGKTEDSTWSGTVSDTQLLLTNLRQSKASVDDGKMLENNQHDLHVFLRFGLSFAFFPRKKTMTKDSPRDDSGASGVWTSKEHERFLEGMAMYPRGPWRAIADHVGTRSLKQVQTHAQKYQQKLLRHQRGLRKNKLQPSRMEHRVDEMTVDQFTKGAIMRKARPVCWPRHSRLSPYVLKHVEPVPFDEPQEPMDWNLHEVQLLLETLDVTMC